METPRALVTVLFTDIVDSTKHAAELRDEGWRALLERHDALVRRELRRFHATAVNTTGDGFLAAFESPDRAIRCAGAIRDAVRELGLEVRSGLHMGQVEGAGKSLGGLAVHIGSRVMAQAGPGEVLVSSTVRDALAGSRFDFENRGVHALKGVPGEWRLYAVTGVPGGPAAAEPGRWPTRLRTPLRVVPAAVALALLSVVAVFHFSERGRGPGPIREAKAESAAPGIAVLPFITSGRGTEELREGMVDLLSTNLDGVPGLRAIDSRTVLARWGEASQGAAAADLRTALDIARRSGATYALIGNAVAVGSEMRLAADVYELKSGRKLGHAQVEGSPEKILELVDRLSIEVLRVTLQGQEGELPQVNLARITTASLPALKAYLEGEVALRRSDFTAAIGAFERAVEADSTFALALGRLGTAHGWQEGLGGAHLSYMERAARFADRLPEREARLIRAELALSRLNPEAIELATQAVEQYPEDVEAWYLLGDAYFHVGFLVLAMPEKADEAFQKAVELDPSFAPAYIHLINNVFNVHADSARAAKLIASYEKVAQGSEYAQLNRVAFSLVFGDSAAHARALEELASVPGTSLLVRFIGYVRHPSALEEQAEVLEIARRAPNPFGRVGAAISLVFNYLSRGKLKAALEILDNPLIPRDVRTGAVLYAYASEMPVPQEWLERELTLAASDTAPTMSLFFAGVYAAIQERWNEVGRAASRLDGAAERARSAGDSTKARLAEFMSGGLEAYELAGRGRVDEAVRKLKGARQEVAGSQGAGGAQFAWGVHASIGRILAESGRAREAEPYLASLPPDPLNFYHLGKLYEKLEEWEKARRSYELFVVGWQDAEPELQPRVEEARAAISRLSSVIRE